MVEFFIRNLDLKKELDANIRLIGDLERLISKVPLGKVNPREVVQLKRALNAITPIKDILAKSGNASLEKIADGLNPCAKMRDQIEKEIQDDPPVLISKGNVINNGKDLLLDIQRVEAERTGISSLKIGFNNVFGYYLEVTNKYKDSGKVPDGWVRKQTLSNAERYITDDLKKLETKILSAEEKIQDLENELFQALVLNIADYVQPIQHNANLIAQLDCLMAFAKIALKNEYCRPTITEDGRINIKEGRHPVIEQQLPLGESYIPNDVYLDNEEQQILMITGPNMAGKSALLRQTALICLMGQMGSFVPAKSASIGIVDKVFTRVGASDNISSGESTFMVEMNETASIMNNISDNSLILLDEIGRGTSTFDGVSIAWSIAEFLHTNGIAKPKTLFATHYHELNELSTKFPRIKNFHISTKEVGQKVIFLRKLVEGGSNHSFGIYVARMAGMPPSIVARATDILKQLEQHSIDNNNLGVKTKDTRKPLKHLPEPVQLSIFEAPDPIAARLREVLEELDVNGMTPIEALMKLVEMKGMV
jgi:DNA mismatch repair protein MutS